MFVSIIIKIDDQFNLWYYNITIFSFDLELRLKISRVRRIIWSI